MFHGGRDAFLHVHVITFLLLLLILLGLPCLFSSSWVHCADSKTDNSGSNEDVIRRELVKVQILQRLGLTEPPVSINLGHKISKELVLETLRRTETFDDITSNSNTGKNHKAHRGQFNKTDGDSNSSNYAKTSEIIAFPEKGPVLNGHNLLSFSYAGNQAYGVRVRKAHLWVKMDYRSSIGRHFGHILSPRGITLYVFQVQVQGNFSHDSNLRLHINSSEVSLDLAVSRSLTLESLGWQKLDVTSVVQKWYGKQSRHRLRHAAHQNGHSHNNLRDKLTLLIDCSGCGYSIHPIIFSRENTVMFTRKDSHHSEDEYPASTSDEDEDVGSDSSSASASSHKNVETSDIIPSENKHTLISSSSHSHHSSSDQDVRPQQLEDLTEIPFLVLETESAPNFKRSRRRAMECSPRVKHCCKQKHYINFRDLGWEDWIIAPRGYYANYCRGHCGGIHRTPDTFLNYHTHVIEEYRRIQAGSGLNLSGITPCCAPTKFSSMSLIYFGPDMNIIKRDLPRMIVEECGCP